MVSDIYHVTRHLYIDILIYSNIESYTFTLADIIYDIYIYIYNNILYIYIIHILLHYIQID